LAVTQPIVPLAPSNRHADPSGEFAQTEGIHTIKPDRVNDRQIVQRFDRLMLTRGRRRIRSKARSGIVEERVCSQSACLVAAKYRGAAPINWASSTASARPDSGVIEVADRMDAGAIFAQAHTPIERFRNSGRVARPALAGGPELLAGVLCDSQAGALGPRDQDESMATHAPKLPSRTETDGVQLHRQPASGRQP